MVSILNSPCYRNTRWALKMMGQWPFQSSGRNKVLRYVTLLFIGSIFLPQLIKILESLNDIDLVMECIPLLCSLSLGLVKFFNWAINQNEMKSLLLAMETDWKNLKVQRDVDLLKEFTERGRKINNLYTITLYGVLGVYLASPGIPKLLDILAPLNESRPRIFLYQTEYFLDQDKYYVHILIHAYLAVPVGLGAVAYFDNLFAIFINHTCGMCEILKCHLEDVHGGNIFKNDKDMMERMKFCSDLQTNIRRFIHDLESSYTIALLFLVGLNMMNITMTGMMAVIKHNEPSELIRYVVFNMGTIFHLFWCSWQGHILIVQSETVYTSAYQNRWYDIHYKFQRMLLPFMMRSLTPCQITAGKLYVMSMDSFGAAMRLAFSGFTLLLSIR